MIASIAEVDLVEAGLGAGDPIAEHRNGIVEAGAHAADVGIDVGHPLADGLVDASLGGDDAIVDPVLGLVDPRADDVRHLGLLAGGLGRHLVHPGGEQCQAPVELFVDLSRHLVEAGFGGLAHHVEVLHHRAGLLIELADAAIERRQVLFELALAVLELLDDRASSRLDGGSKAGVGLVGDPADPQVDLLVSTLRLRGELGESLLDRRQHRSHGRFALFPGGSLGGEFATQPLHLRRDLLAEVGQQLLNRRHDAGSGLLGHRRSFRRRRGERPVVVASDRAEKGVGVVIGSVRFRCSGGSLNLYRPLADRS